MVSENRSPSYAPRLRTRFKMVTANHAVRTPRATPAESLCLRRRTSIQPLCLESIFAGESPLCIASFAARGLGSHPPTRDRWFGSD